MLPIDQSKYLIGNWDMLLCYFSLGLLLQLPVTVMRYFLVDDCTLGPAKIAEVAAIISFPWAVKPVTAFFSEEIVSKFLSRNVQIALAYALSGLCWFAFLFFNDDLFLVLFYGFLSSFFSSFADVCQDAAMVRRINSREAVHGRGRLQSFVLASRSFGSLVGSFLSGGFALLDHPFLFIALLHFVGVFSGWRLRTLPIRKNGQRVHKSTCKVCTEICEALLYPERWLFVLTLFILALPLSDFAILQYFFQKVENIKPITFAITDAISCVFMILASLFFNWKLKDKNWKSVIMLTQCIMFVVIASNLLLINRWIIVEASTYMFIKSTIASFFGQLAFMPLVVKAADLTVEGYEGTFYSLYMSTLNLGSVVSEEISGAGTRLLNVNAVTGHNTEIFYAVVLLSNVASLLFLHRFAST